ncbi:aldo/keto reductase [Pandoraea norimbergensis]|uniref:Aldo/keto reductase n=1 Tax=Pandoraea norimbergensis TaxID=93219 RepID=A0ABN4JHL5_9BURK|nr:aldo/keto reductase [Pandoraea norimbergensis]ALS60388.1 aldo/keto reductase [Pandoraea norimbergensis]
MRTVTFQNGEAVPVLGQGTWMMGEKPERRREEIAALRHGVSLGMTLVDTAEMYGEGATERLVGEALDGLRDQVFLVSKVYPHNGSRRGVIAACERSLERLGTDRLDLYLLHWRGTVPLEETIEGFEALRDAGKIRHWGVSNFDTDDMEELFDTPGGDECVTNQVLYNLSRRVPEYDLIPWLAERDLPVMAYSPIEQGRLPTSGVLGDIARAHNVAPLQVALAWVLHRPGVIAIPKASSEAHVRANRAAHDLELSPEELSALNHHFEAPSRKRPLEMI